MTEKEPVGSWTTWARYVIETLKNLCESIEKLESRLDEYVKKSDCVADESELKASIISLRSTLSSTTTDLLKLSGRFESHIEKHNNAWKWVAIVGGVLGIIATILGILEKIGKIDFF